MNPILGGLIVLAFTAGRGLAGPPQATLRLREEGRGVFGGREAVVHAEVAARKAFSGRMTWRLSAGDRTLFCGEREIDLRAAHTKAFDIRLPIPPVNAGVVYSVQCSVAVVRAGDRQPVAEVERTIWVFSEEPFHDRKQWLEALKIHLFDPAGRTRERLDAAGVPSVRVPTQDALAAVNDGLVLVGEGLSLEEYRAVPDILMRLAAGGRPVLCLSPVDGAFVLAGAEDGVEPESMIFRREEIIRGFDKRLDARGWPPDGRSVAGGLTLNSDRNRVVAAGSRGGWPWFEMRFGNGGRLVVCGFAIIEKWETGPAPRFLFARILDALSDDGPGAGRGEPDHPPFAGWF